MISMKKLKHSKSPEDTEELAAMIGAQLKGGEVIELTSDLGGGKTTFTRGLVRGAGSTDQVTSPTFTISNSYETDKFRILHLDFYRLHQAGIIEHELHENIDSKHDVLVVEWSDVVRSILPKTRLKITIKATGDTERKIQIDCPEKLKYLVAGL